MRENSFSVKISLTFYFTTQANPHAPFFNLSLLLSVFFFQIIEFSSLSDSAGLLAIFKIIFIYIFFILFFTYSNVIFSRSHFFITSLLMLGYELTKNNIKLWENEFSLFLMSSWQCLFSYSGHYFFLFIYFHFRYFLCVSFLMSFTWHSVFPSSVTVCTLSIGSFLYLLLLCLPKMIYNSIIESKWHKNGLKFFGMLLMCLFHSLTSNIYGQLFV